MKSTLLMVLAFTLSITAFSQVKDIDGNEYKTVKIGNQVWMAENLNVSRFRNGDSIREIKSGNQWHESDDEPYNPAWCFYNNEEKYGNIYGKLYNWHVISDPRGIAPEGWHIPSNKEWNILVAYLEGCISAGQKMKDSVSWTKNANGTNEIGFNAQAGGSRAVALSDGYGIFRGLGEDAQWWSADKADNKYVKMAGYCTLIGASNCLITGKTSPGHGMYIRCIKD